MTKSIHKTWIKPRNTWQAISYFKLITRHDDY